MFDFVCFLHREETSRPATALAANPSMVPSLQMRTSPSSTPDLEFCPWPTPDPTRMDLNSSFVPWRLSGWMASMWCLAVWQTAWMLWRRLRLSALSLARPPSRWSLPTAANWHRRRPCHSFGEDLDAGKFPAWVIFWAHLEVLADKWQVLCLLWSTKSCRDLSCSIIRQQKAGIALMLCCVARDFSTHPVFFPETKRKLHRSRIQYIVDGFTSFPIGCLCAQSARMVKGSLEVNLSTI